MDAPPAQIAPAAPSSTASVIDYRPVTAEEAELCRTAGRFDWAYLGVMVLADAGTVVLDSGVLQSNAHAGVRLVGPGLVGLSWGWSIGGAYLTLPQCRSDWAHTHPLEGDTRREWPLALGFSLLAGAMAPVIVGVETGEGNQTLTWSPGERVMRLVIASATGVVGSVMPYVLPPRTWRAMRKLENLHAGADAHGALVTYAVRF